MNATMTTRDVLAIFVVYALSPCLLLLGLKYILKGRDEKRAKKERERQRAAISKKRLYIEKL